MLSDPQVTFPPPPQHKEGPGFQKSTRRFLLKKYSSHIIDKNFPFILLGKYYIY